MRLPTPDPAKGAESSPEIREVRAGGPERLIDRIVGRTPLGRVGPDRAGRSANLSGANLSFADLTSANLSGANLGGALVSNVALTIIAANGIDAIWSHTIYPDGTGSDNDMVNGNRFDGCAGPTISGTTSQAGSQLLRSAACSP